jgi:TPR repeat protein
VEVIISMSNTLENSKPPSDRRFVLTYLAIGAIGLACAGLAGRLWQASLPSEPTNLRQAVYDFDTGHLSAATTVFRKLADAGDPHAAYWYGHALDLGLGVPADPKAAIVQYAKAWTGGVTQAGTRLGELYLDGNAVPQDFAKARSYLTEAGRRGDARAALDVGRMLREGIGGPADPVAAYAWLEVASLHGNAQARAERDRLLPALSPAQQVEASQQAARIDGAMGGQTVAAAAKM